MLTKTQLIKGLRGPKQKKKLRIPSFIKGTCVKVTTMTPKKPNSAQRKIAKVKVVMRIQEKRKNDNFKKKQLPRFIIAKIPGEGHNLREHSVVLLFRRRTKDCPGVKFQVLRGKYDSAPVAVKKQGRSRVGTKKPVLGQEEKKTTNVKSKK